jgi:glycosyltransferase involved in cell wall biosynthesis
MMMMRVISLLMILDDFKGNERPRTRRFESQVKPGLNKPLMIIALLNAFTEGISGGDTRAIEAVKGVKDVEKLIVTSCLGRRLCEDLGLSAEYLITSVEDEIDLWRLPLIYICRILRGLAILCRTIDAARLIIFSSSDFLPDVIPAFLLRKRNPTAKWLGSIYHLIPPPSRRTGTSIAANILSYVAQQLSLRILRNADKIQTESKALKVELVERYRFASEKIAVIPSGIDTNKIKMVSVPDIKSYDACFVARLHASKGVFDLPRVWKEVCNKRTDAKLAIGGRGSGELLNTLQGKVREQGLEKNVKILGSLTEHEKYSLLKSSQVYVLPSYEEGVPITFLEAMYCKLPIVTYYLPSYNELRELIVGVPVGDTQAMSQSLLELLESASLRAKYVVAGYEYARKLNWENVSEAIFRELR